MPTFKDILTKNLQRILREKKLSQVELAQKVGLSYQTINAIIKGRKGLTSDTLSKLAEALEVEESELIAIPKQAPERVELSKEQWEKLIQQTSNVSCVPPDVERVLARMPEKSRENLFHTLRRIKHDPKN